MKPQDVHICISSKDRGGAGWCVGNGIERPILGQMLLESTTINLLQDYRPTKFEFQGLYSECACIFGRSSKRWQVISPCFRLDYSSRSPQFKFAASKQFNFTSGYSQTLCVDFKKSPYGWLYLIESCTLQKL